MSLANHLPALQVVLPLLAAPLTVLVRRAGLAFVVAVAASWCALAIALMLAVQVHDGGAFSYAIGNWQAPLGIEYRVDELSSLMLVLVAGTA
ncbi:MAG TPA: cation:proton antiporter, partial [Rubrivivax sp.]|nr:cation:proton antiporter [Rubrivivax sp.]